MYAYFGGVYAPLFSRILPWTGMIQLIVGALGEAYALYVISDGELSLGTREKTKEQMACSIALILLTTYMVLFTRDLMNRGKKVARVKGD